MPTSSLEDLVGGDDTDSGDTTGAWLGDGLLFLITSGSAFDSGDASLLSIVFWGASEDRVNSPVKEEHFTIMPLP